MELCSKVQGVISQSVLPVKDENCVCMMILGVKSSSGVVSACWVSSLALAVIDRLGKISGFVIVFKPKLFQSNVLISLPNTAKTPLIFH